MISIKLKCWTWIVLKFVSNLLGYGSVHSLDCKEIYTKDIKAGKVDFVVYHKSLLVRCDIENISNFTSYLLNVKLYFFDANFNVLVPADIGGLFNEKSAIFNDLELACKTIYKFEQKINHLESHNVKSVSISIDSINPKSTIKNIRNGKQND